LERPEVLGGLAAVGVAGMTRTASSLFLLAAIASAHAPWVPPKLAQPDTPEQAAAKVVAAFEAKHGGALGALAERDDPDPWLVADELCARGEHDAADAFARAAPRKDVEKLPRYVAARRGEVPDAAARRALAVATAALASDHPEAALDALRQSPAHGDPVASILAASARGEALRRAHRPADDAEAFLEAARGASDLGWISRASVALGEAGGGAFDHSDYPGALAAWERKLEIDEARGDRRAAATTLRKIGNVHYALGDGSKSLAYNRKSLELMEALGDTNGIAAALNNIALVHDSRGDYQQALAFHERSLELEEESGNLAGVAISLANISGIHLQLLHYEKALECTERMRAIAEELHDARGVARAIQAIGQIQCNLGNHAAALAHGEDALKRREALGDRQGVADSLELIGEVHYFRGDYGNALACEERALKLGEGLSDRPGIARSLLAMGATYISMGEYAKALASEERALRLSEELERPLNVAICLMNIGHIHLRCGDHEKALSCEKRALEVLERIGALGQAAAARVNIGAILSATGDYVGALDYLQRGFHEAEQAGERRWAANALLDAGAVCYRLGQYAKALDSDDRALRLMEDLGYRAGVGQVLVDIARAQHSLGNYRQALEQGERALKILQEAGDGEAIAYAWLVVGDAQLALGSAAKAAASAREAVRALGEMSAGLAEEEGAGVRDRLTDIFDLGTRAGLALADPSEVCFFVESGRAATLLEMLGGRDALRAAVLPDDLRAEEAQARAAEALALDRHRTALQSGSRAQDTRKALDEARGRVADVIERIQREAKAAAGLVCPKVASLAEIQGRLRENEAVVLYALYGEEALALVVARENARIVALGRTDEIVAKCVQADAWEQPGAAAGDARPENATAALRAAVVDPLRLGNGIRRVFVSPQGALSYVSFAPLCGDREVVYVPSGTAYGLLLDTQHGPPGSGVLALGDPDGGAGPGKATVQEKGGSLPGAREEARSVGDLVLLGSDATPSRLAEALAMRPRWRSVHLACHALVNTEHPLLSSLALRGARLGTLDVYRSSFLADLVVLSACETGRGRVYESEGIVGFVRAFMFAGAPRVISSLWKVDDDATRALMVKFYELWNPKDGSNGLPTATALRKAMEFVRDNPDHPEWRDPKYWAAWQLWGLPD